MDKMILSVVLVSIISGCGTHIQDSYDDMCKRQLDSVMCKDNPVNDNKFDTEYLLRIEEELNSHFIYAPDEDYWMHNNYTNQKLVGDCEDYAMTIISQIISDGFPPQDVRLVMSGVNGDVKHAYVQVKINGAIYNINRIEEFIDLRYMQLDNTGSFTQIIKFRFINKPKR